MSGKFESKYGYFTEDGKEYVITRPDTPKPWVNVISNGDFGMIVSQAGGGFSWRRHSNFNRLTRWNQDLVQDNWGKFIYIRDRDNNDVWSAALQPVKNPGAKYHCRHGLGYSVLCSEYVGVESEWTLFVAVDAPVEIWLLKIANHGKRPRHLSLFTYFEWCLGFAPDNHREFHKTFIETRFDTQDQVLFATKRLWEIQDEKGRNWNRDWPFVAFFSASESVVDFDGDKELFLGRNGDVRMPAAVSQGQCSNSEGKWGDAMACLHIDVNLAAGESKTIAFALGATDNAQQAIEQVKKYRNLKTAQAELARVKSKWEQRLTVCHVETPDDAFNFMTNTWLKYQAISARLWGRAAYYQQSGAYGFRDQLQDSQVFLPMDAELTRRQIKLHAEHQFKDGSVYHWWHPYTETGLRSNVSDNLLWLPFVVIEYIKETGSMAILDEQICFADDTEPAPLWLHCKLVIERALAWRSERGLPLIGAHDWNDGLNAVGNDMRGESIWMAHFLHRILREFAGIIETHASKEQFKFCLPEADRLKQAVNAHGWDGEWYWRATKDNGELVGSHQCTEGKIYLNAQTWSVIANTATPQRAEMAMSSAEKHLNREYGPLLLQPAYSKPDSTIGYITRYAPGRRENGGLYTHASAWAIWAETLLGKNDVAFEMYKNFCPIYRGLDPDLYHAEPYVTPGNVDGPESPVFGRGGWTWYTGSAAWLFKISLEQILGIRPHVRGLIIDPCIPSDWKGFTVHRQFRGAFYEIKVEADENGAADVIQIDGKFHTPERVDGSALIPVFPAGTRHVVIYKIGKRKGK
ncbi:MAG: GH36-type glycosyl hydrolase domain-containing protein [Candidatus Zhuqueibacterota bacterium]